MPTADAQVRRLTRARRVWIYIIVGSVLLTGGGWFGSQFMTTPAQVAAAALPPKPSVITAPVENRLVSNQLVTRGTVQSPQQVNVLSSRTAEGAKLAVVTALPVQAGAEILQGSVVVELSGRPVIVLLGQFAAYRDLGSGDSGTDVVQLQKALASLGISVGRDHAGTYDRGTSAAIAGLYKKLGYAPQPNLPMSEVLFLPSFPARVESGTAQIGSDASHSTLNVATGALGVYVQQDAELSQIAKSGSKVEISSELLGKTVGGTVTDTGARQPNDNTSASTGDGAQPSGGTSNQILIAPDGPLASEWADSDVRVTFVTGSSDGKVIAVPSAAVFATADGTKAITTLHGSRRARIVVTTGVSGGGYVEIRTSATKLRVGEQVIVGVG